MFSRGPPRNEIFKWRRWPNGRKNKNWKIRRASNKTLKNYLDKKLGLSYKSQNWKKWTKFEFWARSGWSHNDNVRQIILPGELTSHAFYTWASGSDIWGNPIPRYDTNKLIGLDWIWLYCTHKPLLGWSAAWRMPSFTASAALPQAW